MNLYNSLIATYRRALLSILGLFGRPVGEIFGLLPCADELDDGEELLVSVNLLLLFQDEHKVMAEARLHHNPIHGTGEVDVRREEDYVLA